MNIVKIDCSQHIDLTKYTSLTSAIKYRPKAINIKEMLEIGFSRPTTIGSRLSILGKSPRRSETYFLRLVIRYYDL